MARIVITYARDDLRVAEAMRCVLGRLDAEVHVDSYVKPGRRPAEDDRRYGLADGADVLLIINPRPDSDGSQPRSAVGALRQRAGVGAAETAAPLPLPEAFLCQVNGVGADPQLTADLRAAEGDGALRFVELGSRLTLLYQHSPATFESMIGVRDELCAASRHGLKVGKREPRLCWARLRYGVGSRVMWRVGPAVAALLVLLPLMDSVNGSFDLTRRFTCWALGVGCGSEPASTPGLTVFYTNPRGLPVPLSPENTPPTVVARTESPSDRPLKIEATTDRPGRGRRTLWLCVPPDGAPEVRLASGGGPDEHHAPFRVTPEAAGVYTLLAISVPAGGPSAADLLGAVAGAIKDERPNLLSGVWLEWAGTDFRWRFPDDGKSMVEVAAGPPPESRWAIALRDAVLGAGWGEGVMMSGWSFLIEERGGAAGGGP